MNSADSGALGGTSDNAANNKAAKKTIDSVCVYLGANFGRLHEYEIAALGFGEILARRNISLVYGGASNGCMGAVADAVLAAGGHVHGVIPRSLEEKELAHRSLTKLDVVETMHERKARMAQLADAFVALPGGAGTMEELFEVWTWMQIGYHTKPIGLYNVRSYYDKLVEFITHVAREEFMKEGHLDALIVDHDPHNLIDRICRWEHVPVVKWFNKAEDDRVWGVDLDRNIFASQGETNFSAPR